MYLKAMVLAGVLALVMPLFAVIISVILKNKTNSIKVILNAQMFAVVASVFALAFHLMGGYSTTILSTELITIDSITVLMLATISVIGTTVIWYAERNLGNRGEKEAFLRNLSLLALASSMVAVSNNLFLTIACWHAISICLYKLVKINAVDKKTGKTVLAHHLSSDIMMLVAFLIIAFGANTSTISHLPENMTLLSQTIQVNGFDLNISFLSLACILMVISMSIKSALFPFHRWLMSTINAATPLSGFLHAGVVNISAILAARFMPLLAESQAAIALWLTIALIACFAGTVAMTTQPDVKRKLAYSTVGQMGFMCLQCATGMIPLAIFHLIAHGFFKCHLFLQAGNTIQEGTLKLELKGQTGAASSQRLGALTALIIVTSLFGYLSWTLLSSHYAGGYTIASFMITSIAFLAILPFFQKIGLKYVLAGSVAVLSMMAFSWLAIHQVEAVIPDKLANHQLFMNIVLMLLGTGLVIHLLVKNTPLKNHLYVHSLNGFYVEEIFSALARKNSKTQTK